MRLDAAAVAVDDEEEIIAVTGVCEVGSVEEEVEETETDGAI